MTISRRAFLKGTAALFVAPAVIKADNLMKVATPTRYEYGMVVDAGGVTLHELYAFLKYEWSKHGDNAPPFPLHPSSHPENIHLSNTKFMHYDEWKPKNGGSVLVRDPMLSGVDYNRLSKRIHIDYGKKIIEIT